MARAEIPASLQESILATLCFDSKWGGVISTLVTGDHFDGQFRDIAGPVLDYVKKYRKAPGRTHLDDLFGKALVDEGRSRAAPIRRLLFNLASMEEGLNGEYVARQASYFVQSQVLKTALMTASERYGRGGDDIVEDVKDILQKALRGEDDNTFDAGVFLSDDQRGLAFLDKGPQGISFGIDQLDHAGICMVAKQMTLYIGPKGSGKTWFCVQCGRQGLLNGARVLHVSLEVREEVIAGRYYANIFGGGARDGVSVSQFEFDRLKRWTGMKRVHRDPKINFSAENAKSQLRKLIKGTTWGIRFGRIVVKAFPTRQLTVSRLRQYLDWLEVTKRFIPTLLIVDYPDLMQTDKSNYRISLGIIFEELRGLAVERNLALICPTQGSRGTIGASRVRSTGVAEDISKVFTADDVLAYSQTSQEKKLNLARLSIEHARNVPGGTEILLSQAYGLGQYVLQSAYMTGDDYWSRVKVMAGPDDDDDPDEDETD